MKTRNGRARGEREGGGRVGERARGEREEAAARDKPEARGACGGGC